jgi:hypothetical protein
MTTANYNLVPLQQANLCLDCETITASQANCFACGSRALLNVARVLNEHRSQFDSSSSSSSNDQTCPDMAPMIQIPVTQLRQRNAFQKTEPNLDLGRRWNVLPIKPDVSWRSGI